MPGGAGLTNGGPPGGLGPAKLLGSGEGTVVQDCVRPPTQADYLETREVALELRTIAQPGTTAGIVLCQLGNAVEQAPRDSRDPHRT